MLFQMERCPRCQTPLGAAPQGPRTPEPSDNFFGMERQDRERDRTRDRSEVGDRSAMKQEMELSKQELGANKSELDAETEGVRRERLRSEIDGFNKGSDEHVVGAPPAPTPVGPTAYKPPTYSNPYLNKQNLPDPRAQFMPVSAQQPAPPKPVNKPAETMGMGSSGMFERSGMGSAGTFERVGMGSAGASTMEFVLDNKIPELREVDDIAFQLYGVDMRSTKSTFCETPQEWMDKYLAGEEMPKSQRDNFIQNADAMKNIRGVFLATKGLFINSAAFEDPMGANLPTVISTAAHEKLGHGFCNTFTLKGQDEAQATRATFRLAEAFGMKQMDEPSYPIWEQKRATSLRSSFFLEEGFSSWIQDRLVKAMAQKKPGRGFEKVQTHATTLQEIMAKLQSISQSMAGQPIAYRNLEEFLAKWLNDEAERIRHENPGMLDYQGQRLETVGQAAMLAKIAIGAIVADDGVSAARVPSLMMAMTAADAVLSSAKAPVLLRYDGGYLMMTRIEMLFGERCVPAAVRIAGNVRYNIATISVPELVIAVSNANYNVDARLASICRLQSDGSFQKNDAKGFAKFVNKTLGYSIPEGM